MKHGVPQGPVLGSLLFLVYVNDLAFILRKHATPVVFVDDTSIIISANNENEFWNNVRLVVNETYNWCQSNFLTLNLEKTYFIQFCTNHQRKLDFRLVVFQSLIAPNF